MTIGKLGVHWLWCEPYKGLSVEWAMRRQVLWLGRTPREWKERGW